jgi:hypothetical protein
MSIVMRIISIARAIPDPDDVALPRAEALGFELNISRENGFARACKRVLGVGPSELRRRAAAS